MRINGSREHDSRTARPKELGRNLHLSTTVRSTLLIPLTCSSNLVALIFSPHSGLVFGFVPFCSTSKTKWLIETILSVSEEVTPHAPRPGP